MGLDSDLLFIVVIIVCGVFLLVMVGLNSTLEERKLERNLSCLSDADREYLTSDSRYRLLDGEQRKQVLKKKCTHLFGKLVVILIAFLVAFLKVERPDLILWTFGFGIVLCGLSVLYEYIITSDGIYEVRAVCLDRSCMHRDVYQYVFAFYDFHNAIFDDVVFNSDRSDVRQAVAIGTRTKLLLIVRKGRMKAYEWMEL